MTKELVAVVLAGGIGKRFWPLITYKSLFPFAGKSVVHYVLGELSAGGVARAIVVTNPNDFAAMSQLAVPGITVSVVVQPTPNGMAGALLSVKEAVGNHPMLVVNAEDMVDTALYKTIGSEIKKQKPFIVGKKTATYIDAGYVKLGGETVEAIVEKPGPGHEPSDFVNLVFHFYPDPSAFFSILEKTQSDRDNVYEVALSTFAKIVTVHFVGYEGVWAPLKYPWHVLDMMEIVLGKLGSRKGKNVDIRKNVITEGNVVFGDNVKVFENTKIVGPCYIGDNTIIGNNNIIRQSHIGINCVTGFNTDITRSYVGDNCWFHSNYVGDSVLEEDISMGSGTVLANLRLDRGEIASVVGGNRVNTRRRKLGALIGKSVRIGVNTSIMPGVKIGHDSMVGAGLVVNRDIPDVSKKLL